MSNFFDILETRSDSERARDIGDQLPIQIRNAKENSSAFSEILKTVTVVHHLRTFTLFRHFQVFDFAMELIKFDPSMFQQAYLLNV